MAQPVIQTSFHAGEWSPNLTARVDLNKYHAAVSLGENYYVDYRGGLSSRMGTRYVIQAYKSATPVRLIPFQASFTVNYAMEFGDNYIRFHRNGAPVLETGFAMQGWTGNPMIIQANGHNFSIGDWVFISGVVGTTQLNNRFFAIINTAPNTLTIATLDGVGLNPTGYGGYVSGGLVQRVYTISTPYLAADLALLKYAQNVNQMVICHPNYQPMILRLIDATNWTLTTIAFGSQVQPPTNIQVATTLAAGNVNYSYTVTAVDANGQESAMGTPDALTGIQDLRTTAGTNRVTWNAVSGAVRYNVYKAELSYTNLVPAGATHGFIGDTTALALDDSNIGPDFTETPPVVQNPFLGAGVASVTVTNPGSYTTVPTATVAASPGGATATVGVTLQVQTITNISGSSTGWNVGDPAYGQSFSDVIAIVSSVNGFGQVTGLQPLTFPGSNRGDWVIGTVPSNPVNFRKNPGSGFPDFDADLNWGVGIVGVVSGGSGYLSPPAITFSGGTAAATAVLGDASSGNPSVPMYWQQRLVLMGPPGNPQQFNISQPGSFFNYNTSVPTQADDAITGTLVSGQLNNIKSAIPMPSGLIILSDQAAWQLYGNAPGAPISAIEATAQSQAYNGANDVPPIVANLDILYVQAKGSSVRNLSYNFYTNIYTGTDISVLSSHLFFGHTIVEWAWAEEPFKVAWAIRDDGVALSLTFLKEQELVGWTHSITDGLFKSVCAITEQVGSTAVNAPYFVIERDVGAGSVKYIERMADRFFSTRANAWCVDSGLQYSGPPATSFTGAEHLAGLTVTGLADGEPITPFVMPANGFFTLPSPAVIVTLGLAFTPKFRSLRIDTGNPTIQGKMKLLPGVNVRVENTLGLQIGTDENNLVPMDDLVIGNVGKQTNVVVTDLVTGDAFQTLDPSWNTEGQFYIEQPLPYPSTILGVMPQLAIGDTEK